MSSRGSHRAPPRFPFAAVVVAILLVAGVAVGVRAVLTKGDDSPAANGGAPSVSSTGRATAPATTGSSPTTGGATPKPAGPTPPGPPPADATDALALPRAADATV